MSDAIRIVGKLRQIRRRQFIMRLAGASGVACCLFGIIAVVSTFESLRFYKAPGLWLCLLGTGLEAAALAFSFLSMPSWKETVKQADRNLNLQQRLETAWECLPPREVIDHLLLTDAAGRLSSISPASVVPARINRTTGTLWTIGLLAFTALSLVRLLGGSGPLQIPSHGKPTKVVLENSPESGSDSEAEEASAGSQGSASSTDPAFNDSVSVRSAAENFERSAEEVPNSAFLQASPEVSGGSGGDESMAPDRNILPSADFPFRQTAPGEANSAADRSRDAAGTEDSQPERMPPDLAGKQDAADASGSSPAGISGIKKTGNSEGAAAGTQNAKAPEDDTGDIPAAGKTTQPTGTDPESGQDASLQKRLSPDYASRRIEAERALSRENIPPGLKQYIADYFRAIQP